MNAQQSKQLNELTADWIQNNCDHSGGAIDDYEYQANCRSLSEEMHNLKREIKEQSFGEYPNEMKELLASREKKNKIK